VPAIIAPASLPPGATRELPRSYYLVMVFFAAVFIMAFSASNLGALLALLGGLWLKAMGLPVLVTLGVQAGYAYP
jgi:p-aminobenzoyl-glutamate transporter AbgT